MSRLVMQVRDYLDGALADTEVDEMLSAAHASAYHWLKAGGTLTNAARSQWQIARVYSTLGRGEPAMWHARRCVELAEAAVADGVADDWDLPAALETMARPAGRTAIARATPRIASEADESARMVTPEWAHEPAGRICSDPVSGSTAGVP